MTENLKSEFKLAILITSLEDLPAALKRARFPAQWERHTKAQRLVMETRARQLREVGWGAISWD